MMRPFRPDSLLPHALRLGAALLAVVIIPGVAAGQICGVGCGPAPSGPTDQQIVEAANGQSGTPGAAINAIASFSNVIGNRQGQAGPGRTAAGAPLGYAAESKRGSQAETVFTAMAQAPWVPVWNIWAQVYGSRNVVGDSGALPGYNSGAAGVVFGIDRQATADLLYGVALGYSRTNSSGAAMRGTADAYSAALYSTWTPGAFQIEARVGAGAIQNTTARSVPFIGAVTTADGSAGAFDLLANIEAGYRFEIGRALVKPYAGLAWQSLTRDGFTETGPFGLVFPRQTFSKAVSTLGVAGSLTIQDAGGAMWQPEIKVGWGHDLRDDTLVTNAVFGGLPVSIVAAPPGPDAALISAALSYAATTAQNFMVSYSGDFRANAKTHLVSAGFRRQW